MRAVLIGLALSTSLFASAAQASVGLYRFTGTVSSGFDSGHITAPSPFGLPQPLVNISTGQTTGSAFGRAFSLELLVDGTKGVLDSFPSGDQRDGTGADSPIAGLFTMSGVSYEVGASQGSFSKAFLGINQISGTASTNRQRPAQFSGDFTNYQSNLQFALTFPFNLFNERRFGEPIALRDLGLLNATGMFSVSLQDTSGALAVALGPVRTASLQLDFDTFEVVAVPEPTTWAMMIGGFALVGGSMRRRAGVNVSFA